MKTTKIFWKNLILIITITSIIFSSNVALFKYQSKLSIQNTNSNIILEKTSKIKVSGSFCGIEVIGNIAYICDHKYGLQIYDMQDKNNPKLLGKTNDEGIYHGFEIDPVNNLLVFFSD